MISCFFFNFLVNSILLINILNFFFLHNLFLIFLHILLFLDFLLIYFLFINHQIVWLFFSLLILIILLSIVFHDYLLFWIYLIYLYRLLLVIYCYSIQISYKLCFVHDLFLFLRNFFCCYLFLLISLDTRYYESFIFISSQFILRLVFISCELNILFLFNCFFYFIIWFSDSPHCLLSFLILLHLSDDRLTLVISILLLVQVLMVEYLLRFNFYFT